VLWGIALYLGAMTGGEFGFVAVSLFPELSTSTSFYAIVGMDSVSAAILGVPISTALIVFEMVYK
jgi:CIC family chloride channel protein